MVGPNRLDEKSGGKFHRFLCKRPWLVLGVFAVVVAAFTGTAFALDLFDRSSTQLNDRSWIVPGDDRASKAYAVQAAIAAELPALAAGLKVPQWERSTTSYDASLHLIYNCPTGCFTTASLAAIREVENLIVSHPQYEDTCQLLYNDQGIPLRCEYPESVLISYFGVPINGSYPVNAPVTPASTVGRLLDSNSKAKFFFEEAVPLNVELVPTWTRSTYPMGLTTPPDSGSEPFYNAEDRPREQIALLQDRILSDLDDRLLDFFGLEDSFRSTAYNGKAVIPGTAIEVTWMHGGLEEADFSDQLRKDAFWAAVATAVVWLALAVHTRSVLLPTVGLAQAAAAVPIGVVVYTQVYRIDYLQYMHLLLVWVLLGVGADNTALYADALRQSQRVQNAAGGVFDRMAYTCSRGCAAVSLSSFSVAFGFLVAASSHFVPIQSFALLAFISVMALYLLNICVWPAVLTLWSRHCEGSGWCPCSKRFSKESGTTREQRAAARQRDLKYRSDLMSQITPSVMVNTHSIELPQDMQPSEKSLEAALDARRGFRTVDKDAGAHPLPSRAKPGTPALDPDSSAGLRWSERALHRGLLITLQLLKIGFVIIGLLGLGAGIYGLTRLQAARRSEAWWGEEHILGDFEARWGAQGPFLAATEQETASVSLVWGLDGVDRSGVERWDPDAVGKPKYGPPLSLSSTAAQEFLLGVCDTARLRTCESEGCDGDDLLLESVGAECWINQFDSFIRQQAAVGLPIASDQFDSRLLDWYKEGQVDATHLSFVKGADGQLTSQVEWFRFVLPSTAPFPLSEKLTNSVMNEWQLFVDDLNQKVEEVGLSEALGGASFQTADFAWAWASSQSHLVSGSIRTAVLMIAVAFLFINIIAGNLILAVYALISLVGVYTTVFGLGVSLLRGWNIGITEALAVVVVFGFAASPVLHMTMAYASSRRSTRKHRVQDGLTNAGVSIFTGCLAIMLAAAVLWAAELVILKRFAFLIVFTSGVSLLWSIVFLSSLLLICGPERSQGRWSDILACCSCFGRCVGDDSSSRGSVASSDR